LESKSCQKIPQKGIFCKVLTLKELWCSYFLRIQAQIKQAGKNFHKKILYEQDLMSKQGENEQVPRAS